MERACLRKYLTTSSEIDRLQLYLVVHQMRHLHLELLLRHLLEDLQMLSPMH